VADQEVGQLSVRPREKVAGGRGDALAAAAVAKVPPFGLDRDQVGGRRPIQPEDEVGTDTLWVSSSARSPRRQISRPSTGWS